MKIAFATNDNKTVNDHFGWCRQFAIYDVTPADYTFLMMRDVPEGGDDEVDKIDKRIAAIKDCAIIYCSQIGPVAAARVIRERIHPIKVAQPEAIDDVLNKMVEVLKKPPIWLKKVLERETAVPSPLAGEGQGDG
ncbi:MAG: nitrogen fixation protein NifX [Deltaproteobacteria bacterium]|nr:nitrogen fixation protein NifX [Deltaproteobacteria bacterium]